MLLFANHPEAKGVGPADGGGTDLRCPKWLKEFKRGRGQRCSLFQLGLRWLKLAWEWGLTLRACLSFVFPSVPQKASCNEPLRERGEGLAFIYLGVYYALATRLLPLDDTGAMVTGMVLFGVFLALLLMNLAGHRLWGARLLGWLKGRLPWKRALTVAESKVREVEEDVFIAFRDHKGATLLAFALTLCATFCVFVRPQVFFIFAVRAFFPVSHLAMIYTLFIFLGAFFG